MTHQPPYPAPPADHPSTALIGAETMLSGVRLRPTASNRGGTWGTLGWISGAALALAAGWFVFALLKPLATPDEVDAASTPPKVTLAPRSTDVAARESALAGLTGENVFSHKRRAWAVASAAPGTPGTPAGAEGAPGSGEAAAPVAPEASIPQDIKPAYDNLRLVGLFEIQGKPALMLAFASGSDAAKSKVFRVGDEITDPAHPTPTWKVMAIDVARKSAVLARPPGGRQVELKMFVTLPIVASSDPKKTDAAPASPALVVPATRAEVLAKLREAKISEADIALLMKELGPDPDAPLDLAPLDLARLDPAPTGEATAAAIEKVLKPGESASPDGAGAPPAGLEEVLKMMAQRRGQPPPKPAEPKPQARPQAAPAPPKP
ncbi:MAG: hypothetical protein ACKVZJ_08740 [Phycisphaerales bacterium]